MLQHLGKKPHYVASMDENTLAPVLEAIVSYIDEGVIISDPLGNVIYQNPAVIELFGMGNEPVTRLRDIASFNLQKAILRAAIDAGEMDAAGRPTGQFVRFEHKVIVNGSPRYLQFHCGLINTHTKNERLRLIMVRDKTDQRRLEAVFDPSLQDMSTNDPRMLEIFDRIQQIAPTNASILLQGESGTGKTQLARMTHRFSHRSHMPFVEVNCAAIPESLIESELFGHVKGAFTGASQERTGRFQSAHKGTLFLDEITEMPFNLQAKLLRAVQDQEFEMVGSDETVKVDVRIISASNRNLKDMVNSGEFRADLYYRLAVIPLTIPSLRNRPGDIPVLIEHFCDLLSKRGYNTNIKCSNDAMRMMMDYPWPGNVRELENAVEHGVICSTDDEVDVDSLPQDIREYNHAEFIEKQNKIPERREGDKLRANIIAVLEQCHGNKAQAAQLLGIDRSTLWRRMQKLNISK
ncbi:MAG: sigma 54-interacting transcriptional regulator [Gammaproteobacteria bacterium]|nr:sigma 54-interacting transcriptional regulator [Gammaproteobacteria bacterium]